ncbi:MAG TPA: hypothetical protein VM533_17250 [Fimbriiglobus sp.]|nr:hypothetical protein [Fimbriiglobus sp.]
MIRQICPHCLQTVELPDASAGTVANCPRCRELIPVPAAYTPSVDPSAGPAAPPPGYRPSPDPNLERSAVTPSSEAITLDRVDRTPPPPGLASPRTGAAAYQANPAPAPTPGYAKSAALVLTPQGLAWIPVGCLTLVFVLAFFDWAGSYPGGTRLYSQTAWESMFGHYTLGSGLTEKALADQESIVKKMRFSFWLFLAMPLLVATLIVAWAERLLVRDADPEKLPDWLQRVWPHRYPILAGAAGVVLLLILFQSALGFGLESAIRRHVNEQFVMQETAADSPAKKQEVAVEQAKMLNGYGLRMTTARQLAIAASVVAVAALLGRWWLDRRGPNAPLPRVLVQY